ncbi:hypothetical protein ES703_17549 [subsurface metagenome]
MITVKGVILMFKSMRWWVFISIVFISFTSLLILTESKAKGEDDKPPGWEKGEKEGWEGEIPPGIEKKGGWMPPGLSKEEQDEWKDGRPPGWSQGEKTGWKGANTPPGWEKWNDKEKKRWEKGVEKAKGKVRGKAKNLKDFSDEDLTSALLSIEASARVGVPIKLTLSFVEKAMEKGIKGKGIETATRAMTYGVGKEIDFEQLGKFVHEKLDEGLIDDKLSIEIYKEVSGRHEERLKVKEALKQEKEKGKKK